MELSYETRRKLRQDRGPSGEAVFDVIAHHDTGDGIELSHQKVAGEANVSNLVSIRIQDRGSGREGRRCERLSTTGLRFRYLVARQGNSRQSDCR
jgi:hypothetical protein